MIDIIVAEPNKTDSIRVFTDLFNNPDAAMLCIRHRDENSIVLNILEPTYEDRQPTEKEREFLTLLVKNTGFYDMSKDTIRQDILDKALDEVERYFRERIL